MMTEAEKKEFAIYKDFFYKCVNMPRSGTGRHIFNDFQALTFFTQQVLESDFQPDDETAYKIKKEHQIFKKFYEACKDRPKDVQCAAKLDYFKARMLDVQEDMASWPKYIIPDYDFKKTWDEVYAANHPVETEQMKEWRESQKIEPKSEEDITPPENV